jgi:hypothetical protein
MAGCADSGHSLSQERLRGFAKDWLLSQSHLANGTTLCISISPVIFDRLLRSALTDRLFVGQREMAYSGHWPKRR